MYNDLFINIYVAIILISTFFGLFRLCIMLISNFSKFYCLDIFDTIEIIYLGLIGIIMFLYTMDIFRPENKENVINIEDIKYKFFIGVLYWIIYVFLVKRLLMYLLSKIKEKYKKSNKKVHRTIKLIKIEK